MTKGITPFSPFTLRTLAYNSRIGNIWLQFAVYTWVNKCIKHTADVILLRHAITHRSAYLTINIICCFFKEGCGVTRREIFKDRITTVKKQEARGGVEGI